MPADEDDDAVVVPLRRADVRDRNAREAQLEELLVRPVEPWTKPLGTPECKHRTSTVDEQARTLTCRKCGVPLDPFRVIGQLANEGERLVKDAQRWAEERDRLHRLVADLERQERNAKSRVRAARKRRNDEPAMRAAARALYNGRSHRDWDHLSPEYQAEATRLIRDAVEAYIAFPDEPASVSVPLAERTPA